MVGKEVKPELLPQSRAETSWEEPWAPGNGERGQAAGCGIPEFKFQRWSRSKRDKARFFQGCGVEAVTVMRERTVRGERVLGRAQERPQLSLLEDFVGWNRGSGPLGGSEQEEGK